MEDFKKVQKVCRKNVQNNYFFFLQILTNDTCYGIHFEGLFKYVTLGHVS